MHEIIFLNDKIYFKLMMFFRMFLFIKDSSQLKTNSYNKKSQ